MSECPLFPASASPVERAIHDAFADLARCIADQHGIQVNTARFEWQTARQVGGNSQAHLMRVAIDSWHELTR